MPSGSAGRGATIRILLLDGTPDGLRLISNSNWNGLAMMCSRAKYPAIRGRDEFNYPGVYLLYGASEAESRATSLYVGQADNIRERLDNHNRGKEFWSQLAVFTSTSGLLNRAHAQYLESRLIGLAQNARRAEVLNGNAPRVPYLSESDRFDSESFLDQILLLCPVLGLDYFTPVSQSAGPSRPTPMSLAPELVEFPRQPSSRSVQADGLRLVGPGASAKGRAVGGGVEVFAGSVARTETVPSLGSGYVRLREKLEADGVLTRSSDGLVFTKNHTFRSPSGAAMVLLGRPASGWNEWKDQQGRTLRQLHGARPEAQADVE